ncbi:hypothetical protein BJY24_007402 [Nocardia transvalensis]|uniref:Outer membrane channel protein CpnT-like N-terminal domain-containing protein n=1 Tax=Nocardia transvalensis TaxID=37333 RepID=A0A7W9PM57_9NOCA|nr:hypothetical protein [Nocardia transvalensis]MBB5918490.1 hypothetical protein [Nocardia transvalensis]
MINAVAGLAWPNGHQDQLRAARDVWYAAADALGTATTPITTAVSLLENQQSPEIPTAIATCSQSTADYMDLQAGFRELGDACGDYAQQLDDAHSEILDELGKMLAETAAWEVGMAVLIPFTGALSELLGNGAAVARIAVYAARIGRVIERLAGAAATIAARVAASVPVRLRAMASKIGQWLEKAKTKLWKSGDGSPPPVPTPKPPATKPTVNDSKLQNILNDLYKGAGNPDRVGDGTTADAIRNEYANLVPTEGKWHLTKGVESQRALANWLMNRANNDPADRAVAIKELQNLMDALAGK